MAQIPKVIHYCWFGGKPLPPEVLRCMDSWKKYCPDYKIIQWNEQNFDCSQNLYARQALDAQKWAFVTDYVRLKVVCTHGGIYLDTDVELIRPLDDLLDCEAFFGFQANNEVATGLGFGSVPGSRALQAMLADYDHIPFLREDGTPDRTPCPERNTAALVRLGLRPDGTRQTVAGAEIFPAEYFCPIAFETGVKHFTENTHSIHHYHASWKDPVSQKWQRVKGTPFYLHVYRPLRLWMDRHFPGIMPKLKNHLFDRK